MERFDFCSIFVCFLSQHTQGGGGQTGSAVKRFTCAQDYNLLLLNTCEKPKFRTVSYIKGVLNKKMGVLFQS